MKNAVDGRGCSLGVLASSLEAAIKKPDYRNALLRGDLALITPYGSNSGFTVGTAMGRNKLIYCLAEYAVVVSSDLNKGGTWAGASEVLKNDWLPLFVRQNPDLPEGNEELRLRWVVCHYLIQFRFLPGILKSGWMSKKITGEIKN